MTSSWWLTALARGPAAVGGVWPRLLLSLAAVALVFHLVNGVRHLAWDAGLGFEPRAIRATGWAVALASAAAAAFFLWLALA